MKQNAPYLQKILKCGESALADITLKAGQIYKKLRLTFSMPNVKRNLHMDAAVNGIFQAAIYLGAHADNQLVSFSRTTRKRAVSHYAET